MKHGTVLLRCQHEDGRKLTVKTHFGFPTVIEEEPIVLARVKNLTGGTAFCHPRYAPDGKQDIIETDAYRHGRSIDMVLKEPEGRGKNRVTILNVKGAGADADEPLVIHPNLWWDQKEGDPMPKWVAREDVGEQRYWGAVTAEMGRVEFREQVLSGLGIPITPYLKMIRVPSSVIGKIAEIHGMMIPNLVQLTRSFRTNIRKSLFHEVKEPLELVKALMPYYRTDLIIAADCAFINALLRLAKEGKRIYFNGAIVDNRFMDGMFTDEENFAIRDFTLRETELLIKDAITAWSHVFTYNQRRRYLAELKRNTGLDIDEDSYLHFHEERGSANLTFAISSILISVTMPF